jgi:hypothetical protein
MSSVIIQIASRQNFTLILSERRGIHPACVMILSTGISSEPEKDKEGALLCQRTLSAMESGHR